MKLRYALVLCLPLIACAQTRAPNSLALGPLAQQDTSPDKKTVRELEEEYASRLGRLSGQQDATKLIYKLMLAEIALQRGRNNVAASTYLDVARTTRDLRVIKRATEVAMLTRQPQLALDAASLWLEQEPESAQARQVMASVLVATGKLEDAKPNLQKMLANEATRAQTFLQIGNLLGRYPDKQAVLKLVKELAQPYEKLPEARYALAAAAQNADDKELALKEARAAGELRAGWEPAAALEGQLLGANDPKKALEFYKAFLEKHPQARGIRMNYARLLADQKETDLARAQIEALTKDAEKDADTLIAAGALAGQIKDYEASERYFKAALELNPQQADDIRMYLGQLYEDRKAYADAEKWYAQVEPGGEQHFSAQLKVATMLARQNRMDDARKLLNTIEVTGQQRVQLILAEGQLLRDAKEYQSAYERLSKGLEEFPGTADLLYDRAMVAEKLDRIDLLEQDLKLVISFKPDHAHAHNALGYTLADRTDRHQEALMLIEKAIKLAPDDAFIIDSLGWVQYRMGRLDESVTNLRLAFSKRPDPEIAAHLGEVLWAQGNKEEARKIWRDSLKEHPENDLLNATIKKYASDLSRS
jgi:tetratricopeptide (TPR) repeat protein